MKYIRERQIYGESKKKKKNDKWIYLPSRLKLMFIKGKSGEGKIGNLRLTDTHYKQTTTTTTKTKQTTRTYYIAQGTTFDIL